MKITSENILEEAWKGNLEVLKSDLVDQVKSRHGLTSLHYLAWKGEREVLNHPSVDKVKDNLGSTPLHYLASKVKVTHKHLKEKYPWFKIKEGVKVDYNFITEILNTPNSLRFILGD